MKEPEDFFAIYKHSASQRDAVAMLALYDDEPVIFDTWDRGFISPASKWKTIIHEWFSSLGEDRIKVEFDQVSIRQSDEIAYASALIEYNAMSAEGKLLRSMRNRITVCYLKIHNEWKVSHQHMSAPVSSINLTAILDI